MTADSALSLLTRCEVVLFDFDGPLCDVFANRPAPDVARTLEALTPHKFSTDDPLEVLRLAVQLDPTVGAAVEDALIAAEIDAVRVAVPEMDGVAALRALRHSGKRIGIVSNNSSPAIEVFLGSLDLRGFVSVVVGRPYRRPDRMKPDPWSLRRALGVLDAAGERTVFIGDSMTDIEASRRAGIRCVAVANKPAKVSPFAATGVPTVTAMRDLIADA